MSSVVVAGACGCASRARAAAEQSARRTLPKPPWRGRLSNEPVTRLAVPVVASGFLATSVVVWAVRSTRSTCETSRTWVLSPRCPPRSLPPWPFSQRPSGLRSLARSFHFCSFRSRYRWSSSLVRRRSSSTAHARGRPGVSRASSTTSAQPLDRPQHRRVLQLAGFLVLVAIVTAVAGLPNSLGLAEWAPLFFNLAYALPLLVIFRTLAMSDRQVWIGLWLFFAGNWIGQDYLAPQAFAYFVYLTMIAVILAAFRAGDELTSFPVLRGLPPRELRVAAVAVVLVLQLVLAPSHQLTPWVATLAVAALVLNRRPPSAALPVAMAVIAATWAVLFIPAPTSQAISTSSPRRWDRFLRTSTRISAAGSKAAWGIGSSCGCAFSSLSDCWCSPLWARFKCVATARGCARSLSSGLRRSSC